MLVDILAFAFGCLLILSTLNDVFQTAIVPRAVGRRFRVGFYVWRWSWKVWPSVAWRLASGNEERRENLLALFAPAMLMLLPIVWIGMLIVGFGAIFWSVRHGMSPPSRSFSDSAYFAGTSLTTVGFGDIVGRSNVARFGSIVAAATGLGLFSIITAFLFSLFGSFQARETFVVMLGARTGVPPSGVELLTVAGHGGMTANLPTLMVDAQRWVAQVMESHLAYPVLAYFRSS
ncbi:MAG TPA: potassium channel family protein, partial [Candidatus Tumulicola sp.]